MLTRTDALLLLLLDRYGREGYTTTLLEVQKLAYFLQEAGENLGHQFTPSPYGPYTEKVNQVLQNMEGHQIQDYSAERNPEFEITLREGAAEEAKAFIQALPDAQGLLDRVVQLIEGFETPYGLELLATTHWVAKAGSASIPLETLVDQVHAWNTQKRRMFSADHIKTALKRLQDQDWISSKA